jgi:3-oxoacyl-[acyl-carrier-protein] synthase-1/3-oxoacyl-[acyl-carrier-protein] synthase II
LTAVRVYISGMGIITSLGNGISITRDAIQNNLTGIRPLTLFPTASDQPLPVGEAADLIENDDLPRTHQLARLAAEQAMADSKETPDAVVMGVTTGGMLTTENLLKKKARDPKLYHLHATGSVAEDIARRYRCPGPALTVSTACSSGAAALKIALEMLRSGCAKRVLAGGADSLCRLTYYGFNALQLIDPQGARPLDANRRGMSVGEGAAMLLLVANEPDHAVAEFLGAGLSCDAYHPATPHPRGKGALAAMRAALLDAGISITDIDYINLHGTGTLDNDISEARAIDTLFRGKKPLLSSVKGACGHSLAAAGAIEAVVSAISISSSVVPANVGCRRPDPDLKLNPVMQPFQRPIETVLSNSFGFGGNNTAIVLGACGKPKPDKTPADTRPMAILGSACVTGAGRTGRTMRAVANAEACAGMLDLQEISANLSAGRVRRLKRFPRLALSLAIAAHENSGSGDTPAAVFLGTGWGALSETSDFLNRLFETDEQFPSPTDFVGSVHNAAAGQIAMQFQATGANITMTGGDYSFEQSLMAAGLVSDNTRDSFLVIGADEFHAELSRLFDRSVAKSACPADGGGALYLKKGTRVSGLTIRSVFFESSENNPEVISSLIQQVEKQQPLDDRYGVILAGFPAACRSKGEIQLQTLLALTGFIHPVIDYRKLTGEFASASAVAAVMAVKFLQKGQIPEPLCKAKPLDFGEKGALIIGTGDFITAMEVMPQ